MKNQFLKTGILLFTAATLVLSGCKKEKFVPLAEAAKEEAAQDISLTVIADQADADYLAIDINGGDENAAFAAFNEGLTDEYLLDASSYDKLEKTGKNQLIRCLKSVDLSSDQIAKIRKALAAYQDCKATSIKKHRAAYGELRDKVEAARKNLVKQYRNDEITKEEFHKGMKSLRERFHQALKNIKASYAKSLRACFERFLGHLKGILTERQWKAFVHCYKK